MPVATLEAPLPSRSTATSISVSLVVRLTEPVRPLPVARAGRFAITLRPRAMGIAYSMDCAPLYQGLPAFATAVPQDSCIYNLLDFGIYCSYIPIMGSIGPYVWDDDKHASNLADHGIDF